MFAPEQHDLYDGHYILSANRIYMVGGLNDPAGWDHLDNEAKTVKPVSGTAEIDVNDLTNTGTFEARLKVPDGDLMLAIDKFHEFSPCQNGGIVGFLHEHGTDSGCGDNNWPKTFVYLAGWGFGHATLNGKPLYDNYEMHFMVTQGIRDRKTLRVNYPMAGKKQPAGEVNPACSRSTSTSGARSRTRRTSRTARCSCTSSGWRSPGSSGRTPPSFIGAARRGRWASWCCACLPHKRRCRTPVGTNDCLPEGERANRPLSLPSWCGEECARISVFQQIAKERGLNVRVESAGTDPDPAVAPAVATHLRAKG